MKVTFYAALAAVALAGSAAQALTAISATGTSASTSIGTETGSGATNVDFSWSAAQSSGFVTFSVDTTSYLYVTDYSGSVSPVQYTGFMLIDDGTALTTDQANACNNSNVLATIQGSCDLVTNFAGATNGAHLPDTGAAFAVLDSNSVYTIGFYEGAAPAIGNISFQISEGAWVENLTEISPVPLPAGGLLLVGALGGLAALRRRKKAA